MNRLSHFNCQRDSFPRVERVAMPLIVVDGDGDSPLSGAESGWATSANESLRKPQRMPVSHWFF